VATRLANVGDEERVLLALHDTTDLRRLERVRTDFVANVTHEMRSPLASILGFAETLASDPDRLPPNAVDGLERILRNAKRLDRIITDLVELSRLEHATAPQPSAVDLSDFLQEVASGFVDAASEKQLALSVNVEPNLGLVAIDRGMVSQALTNLIDNAIKYSSENGAVEVTAKRADNQLEIAVRDEGPGIPREHQDRIFERFYRVDAARSRAVGGTGLGLAIAKHAAAVHGGRLLVESAVGRGSTFRLSLPWNEA
jgi:signal transduction histidine kinase